MENYKWLAEILFGGLGTAIIMYLFFKKRSGNQTVQKQKSGKNSSNIQVGRDIKIGNTKDDKNEQK